MGAFSMMLQDGKVAILRVQAGIADPVHCADGVERFLQLHRHFITWQTEFDTYLCMNGLVSFIRYYTHVVEPGGNVFPRIVSTDCVAGHFANLRVFHGSGSAPTTREALTMVANAQRYPIGIAPGRERVRQDVQHTGAT